VNQVTAAVEPQASFLMLLPPGWTRLPAREAESETLTGMIDEIIADALPSTLPRDTAEPWRGELRKRLLAAALEARAAGATAVYLPHRAIDGFIAPVSIIESEVDDDGIAPADEVLDGLAMDSGANASRETIDGAAAVRTDTTHGRATLPDDGPEVLNRQVVYTIEVPHREGRWVVMSFSAITAIDSPPELLDALVLLFDAMMTTFRWADVPGAEPSDLELRLSEIHSHTGENDPTEAPDSAVEGTHD